MSLQLVVRDLTKTYETADKKILAISKIDLEIKDREFASVIGPNGCGKSTLMKIVAGVRAQSSGSFHVEGSVAPHGHFHFSKPEYRQEKLVAYMPQDHTLLPWRTVEENLLLPSDIRNISRDTMRKRINDLVAEFGLEQFCDLYPASLSGGMRQKVALLRSVLQEHSLLLLDEPFAPLDALTRMEAQAWLLSVLQKMQISVLMVTHDIREAIFLSDTIYVLSPRPGTIKAKFTVPLPRPRRHDQLQTPKALELEKQLFSLLIPET